MSFVFSEEPLEIARSYFPGLENDQLTAVIWAYTGWPRFWNIPQDGEDPEECLRTQLARAIRTNVIGRRRL